ncbi:hypothetical protein QUA32_18700 [Microcoleus sp. Pol14D6]
MILLVSGKGTTGDGMWMKHGLFSQIYSELPAAINAYKQRMNIEKMFRDRKRVGYDFEGTSLKGNRLINMILLMTLAYSSRIFQGTEMRKKQVEKYISRRKEPKKIYRRRSTFGVGLDVEKWVNYLEQYSDEVEQ